MRIADTYGPWALVTGASDGIGRAIAHGLARDGMQLVLVARTARALDELAAELRANGTHTRVIALDLGHADAVEELCLRTLDLDIGLVVLAAGFGTSGAFLDLGVSEELAMIDVNCRAVVQLAHAFGQRLAKRGRGGIVLLSSLVAFQGVPRAATYAASKAFVQTFGEAIRHELAADGIDVTVVAPGPVLSGFARRARMTMTMAQTPDQVAGTVVRGLRRRARGTLRPGFLSKFLELSLAMLPRFGRVRMMRRIMAGMTHPPSISDTSS